MADIEHLAHLPRWKRAAIWLLTTNPGIALVIAAVGSIVAALVHWFGVAWMVLVLVAGVSYAFGWNAARRRWLRDGYIDKL